MGSGEATETLPETSETPPEVPETLPNSETLPETSATPEVPDMLEADEATEFDWMERPEESSARQVLLFKRLGLLVAKHDNELVPLSCTLRHLLSLPSCLSAIARVGAWLC